MWRHTIPHAPSSMHPSVLYTSSPLSRRYTWDGHTYRHGFASHVRQTCVWTAMNGSSSGSNRSRARQSSTLSGLSDSGFGGSGMATRGRTRGSIFIPDGPAPSTPPVALSAGRTRCEDITGGRGAPGARPGVTDDGRAPERGTGRERAGDRRPQPPIRPPARPRGAARRADPPHPARVHRPDPEAAGGDDRRVREGRPVPRGRAHGPVRGHARRGAPGGPPGEGRRRGDLPRDRGGQRPPGDRRAPGRRVRARGGEVPVPDQRRLDPRGVRPLEAARVPPPGGVGRGCREEPVRAGGPVRGGPVPRGGRGCVRVRPATPCDPLRRRKSLYGPGMSPSAGLHGGAL